MRHHSLSAGACKAVDFDAFGRTWQWPCFPRLPRFARLSQLPFLPLVWGLGLVVASRGDAY